MAVLRISDRRIIVKDEVKEHLFWADFDNVWYNAPCIFVDFISINSYDDQHTTFLF